MKVWSFLPWLSCLVILILCFGSECGTAWRKGRSKRELVRMREARATFPGACATRLPRGKRSLPGLDRRLPRQRRRSSQAEESSSGRGKAVYFTGRGDQLRLKPGVEIPRGNFTLEMWVKPEGGQRSPTVIAGNTSGKTLSLLTLELNEWEDLAVESLRATHHAIVKGTERMHAILFTSGEKES